MDNFILIILCIVAGMVFKATKSIHPEAHKGINTWILYIALPSISFKYIPKIEWSLEIIYPAASMVVLALGAYLFIQYYSKLKNYSNRSTSTLQLASGYSNTSFIGFPLVSAFYGEEYLSIAIICDQAMFLTLSTLGIITALKGGNNNTISAKFLLKRLFTFPPFIGCITALVLSFFIDLSSAEPLFNKLSGTVAPLALFSIGLQLKFNGWKKLMSQISMSMVYKLLIGPALILVLGLVLGLKESLVKITVFESAMPTLVMSSVIAEQFKLNTKLTNMIIGISIIVGFFTLGIWYKVLEWCF